MTTATQRIGNYFRSAGDVARTSFVCLFARQCVAIDWLTLDKLIDLHFWPRTVWFACTCGSNWPTGRSDWSTGRGTNDQIWCRIFPSTLPQGLSVGPVIVIWINVDDKSAVACANEQLPTQVRGRGGPENQRTNKTREIGNDKSIHSTRRESERCTEYVATVQSLNQSIWSRLTIGSHLGQWGDVPSLAPKLH